MKKLVLLLSILIGMSGVVYSERAAIRARHASYQSDCAFCKIIAGEQAGTILYEDADVMVIDKNRQPLNGLKVDCLIIPKKHIRNIKTLDGNDAYDQTILSKIGFVAQKLGEKLSGDGGFRNEFNNEFGQGVFHMHMHFKSPHDWKK